MSTAFHNLFSTRLLTALAMLCALAPLSNCFAQENEDPQQTTATSPSTHAEDPHAGDAHADDHAVDTSQPPGWMTDLALFSLITFVCFLFVLKKVAWGPLIEGLDKREANIRAAIAESEESRRKAQALLADYEEKLRNAERTVAGMVAEAKRDAERTGKDIMAAANAEVELLRHRVHDEIEQAKNTALSEMFSAVNRQVALATEHVLGRALTDEDQERLVGEALQEIGR